MVIAHEAAHLVAWRRVGAAEPPHGPTWRQLVSSVGVPTALSLRAPRSTDPRTEDAVYEHRCPVCQMRRMAKRQVTTWRCASCVGNGLPGTLTISKRRRSER